MIPLLPNPTYFSVTAFTVVPGRTIQSNVNQDYFADDETALAIMWIFSARGIEQVPQQFGPQTVRFNAPDGSPDPNGAVAYENRVNFPPGTVLRHRDGTPLVTAVGFQENAGLLAAYYKRNPEYNFPDAIFGSRAAQLAWSALEAKYEWVLKG